MEKYGKQHLGKGRRLSSYTLLKTVLEKFKNELPFDHTFTTKDLNKKYGWEALSKEVHRTPAPQFDINYLIDGDDAYAVFLVHAAKILNHENLLDVVGTYETNDVTFTKISSPLPQYLSMDE